MLLNKCSPTLSESPITKNPILIKTVFNMGPIPLDNSQLSYINDSKIYCTFVNPSPNYIMSSILKDLIILLKKTASKGKLMFYETYKLPQFKIIEREIASLKSDNFLTNENGKLWLQTNEDKLCFFLNQIGRAHV